MSLESTFLPWPAHGAPQTTGPSSIRRVLAAAVVVCLVLTLEGCGFEIARKYRVGPDPDSDFRDGGARAEVERTLGEPISSKRLADGNEWAVYEYVVRVGISMRGMVESGGLDEAVLYVFSDIATLGLAELLVWMPLAYFGKDKHIYQTEFVYSPAGTIVERFPAREKDHPVQGGWEGCANEADRVLPGKHALEEWRTWVRRCVSGEVTETRNDASGEGEARKKD
jgi:hypothetical protein